MTMKELARLANVSVSTVSKAFADAEDVSDDTKAHIFKIAKEYGCFGRFYRGRYSKAIIAIICPEVISTNYSRYVERLQEIIEDAGGIVLISTCHFCPDNQLELIEYYSSYLRVDGIIVFGLSGRLKKDCDTPIVSLFSTADDRVDTVFTDLWPAVEQTVALLRGLGHRNIAFAGEERTKAKAALFCRAMTLPEDSEAVIVSGDRFEQAGVDCADRILKSDRAYTAVVCAYDDIAFGLIKRLREKGISVPEDMSVTGMDNIRVSRFAETSLTTIDYGCDEVCRAAYGLLCEKMKNKYYKSDKKISFTASLVERQSHSRNKFANLHNSSTTPYCS